MKQQKVARKECVQAGGLLELGRADMAELLDFSGVSEARRFFYMYSVLLLLVLLFHTIQNFDDADSGAGDNETNPEVSRLLEMGDVAKDLY
jgi:hypothetical protein